MAVAALAALILLGACHRDRPTDTGQVTAAERAAFHVPADSSLTVEQVEEYLQAAAAQIELLRAEAPAARARLAAVRRARTSPPGSPRARGGRTPEALWSDFLDESFVRAARQQGFNPAELGYVRERMAVASGYLLASRMQASKDQAASLFRQQAEAMKGLPGVTPAQVETMLRAAEQAERQTEPAPPPPRVAQNLAALRQSRRITPESWGRIASMAAAVGLSDLDRVSEAELGRRLDELAQLHQAVLANREPDGG